MNLKINFRYEKSLMKILHSFILLSLILWSVTGYSAISCTNLEKTANQLEDIEVYLSQYKKFDKSGELGVKFEKLASTLNKMIQTYKNKNLKRSVKMLRTTYQQGQWAKFSKALSSTLRNIHDIKGRDC